MQQAARNLIFWSVLQFALGVSARADIHQTVTLQAGSRINFDTGQVVASGGDLLWDGSSLTPQGTAKALSLPTLGKLQMFKSYYDAFKSTASSNPIPPNKLPVGAGLAVFTNGGNTAGGLVTANSGGSITLEFITFGVVPTGPQIDAVLNNSSLIPDGTPSSGIAPSSIFVVRGSNLADPGEPVLQTSADPGIPLTLNGASLSVVVNGTTVHPGLYYTSPTQLAAVLPANTPVGSGTLTATYNGATSPPAAIQVVAHAPGINTYYTNSGVATDAATGALLTFANSAAPGEIITLWTTGLGADSADSDTIYTMTPHEVDTPVQVYVGGVAANVLYHGSAGFPGVNQVNVTIPDSVPTGCWVSMALVAGGVIGNVATLPINPGGGACVDQLTGLNGNQIANAGGATIRGGLAALLKTDDPDAKGNRTISYVADAAFEKYTGVYQPAYSLSPGSCLVKYVMPAPIPSVTGLDPGSISLMGPNGLSVKLGSLGNKGSFYALLNSNAIPDSGGTFTFTGTGGADVGAFTSTLTLTSPLLTWTNTSVVNSVDRSQDLTLKWTGGNSGSFVYITGGSGVQAGVVSFECLAHADDGQFTVPSHVLLALPAGNGSIGLQNQIYAPLPASGLDAAQAVVDIEHSERATFK